MDPRDIDELASAQLDGEATAEERARLTADPAGEQRLAEFAAARDLVRGAIADVPADVVDAQIAAALDAAEVADAATGSISSDGVVVPMRRRRTLRWASGAAIAAGAAAATLVFGGVLGSEQQSVFMEVGDAITDGGGGDSSAEVATAPQVADDADGLGPSAVEAGPTIGAYADSANARANVSGFAYDDLRILKPIAPVRDDEELRVALMRLLDDDSRLLLAASEAPPASVTSTTMARVPQCPGDEVAAAQLATTALLRELAGDDLLIAASVQTVLDGDAVTVLLLSTAPDAPIVTMLVLPDNGCDAARVL